MYIATSIANNRAGFEMLSLDQELLISFSVALKTIFPTRGESAAGGNIRDKVKLVLAEPQLWQLVGAVQSQLHHQGHQDLFIHGVRVNDGAPWVGQGALALRAVGPGWGSGVPCYIADVVVVAVEFLELHAG